MGSPWLAEWHSQAMEWAVCGCPEDYGKLVRASGAFQMHSHIETAVDKMATP
jgi:hypothetical protein